MTDKLLLWADHEQQQLKVHAPGAEPVTYPVTSKTERQRVIRELMHAALTLASVDNPEESGIIGQAITEIANVRAK